MNLFSGKTSEFIKRTSECINTWSFCQIKRIKMQTPKTLHCKAKEKKSHSFTGCLGKNACQEWAQSAEEHFWVFTGGSCIPSKSNEILSIFILTTIFPVQAALPPPQFGGTPQSSDMHPAQHNVRHSQSLRRHIGGVARPPLLQGPHLRWLGDKQELREGIVCCVSNARLGWLLSAKVFAPLSLH